MSAAQSRAELAAIGCDLLALEGGPGERRVAALLDRLNGRGTDAAAATFDDLKQAPDWLRLPRATQRRVAKATALLSMGATLANSIDGAWLGGLAEAAGEDLLDWAIEAAPALNLGDGPALAPDVLESHGFALMRARLRPGLRSHLAWTPGAVASEEQAAHADALIAAALEAPEPR